MSDVFLYKNKGFTLIELLAVIIILSIISLIITPVVVKVIENAQKDIFINSAYSFIRAGNLYYADNLREDFGDKNIRFVITDGSWVSENKLVVSGKLPRDGEIAINKKGQIAIAINNDKWCVKKGFADSSVEFVNNIDDCEVEKDPYIEELLNGADPEIGSGMIPIIIEDSGIVKKANLSDDWYRYEAQKWANVVLVDETKRNMYENAKAETIIPENDILAYLVWIPRYKYELWDYNDGVGTETTPPSSPKTVNIIFQDKETLKENGSTSGTWLTHPSFTFGDEELNGYWVGKFETGYRQKADLSTIDAGSWSVWTTVGAEQVIGETEKILIKPNIPSWRNVDIKNIFNMTKEMSVDSNIFGLSSTADSHLMKNIEWGAVAYLSHSIYGINKEIRINNSSNYITGCSSNIKEIANKVGCGGTDSLTLIGVDNSRWNTSTGYLASTTGNITGVYDMSGGSSEFVMGYAINATTVGGSSGFTADDILSFTAGSNKKYLDVYSPNASLGTSGSRSYVSGLLGDATKELGRFGNSASSWYFDVAIFVRTNSPWFSRGSSYSTPTAAGAFAFGSVYGSANTGSSFRIVMLGL